MQTHAFEKLSVQTTAECASVSRATFYDHYPDKSAMLDGLVSERFFEFMYRRGVAFDGSCDGALYATALAVCDYLAASPRPRSEGKPVQVAPRSGSGCGSAALATAGNVP